MAKGLDRFDADKRDDITAAFEARLGMGYQFNPAKNAQPVEKNENVFNIETILSDVELIKPGSLCECDQKSASTAQQKTEMIQRMLGLSGKAGTKNFGASASAQFSRASTIQKSKTSSFYFTKVLCKTWDARIRSEGPCHGGETLVAGFISDVDGSNDGATRAKKLEETYGTHYLSSVKMGAGQASVLSSKGCEANSKEEQRANTEVSGTAPVKGFPVTLNGEASASDAVGQTLTSKAEVDFQTFIYDAVDGMDYPVYDKETNSPKWVTCALYRTQPSLPCREHSTQWHAVSAPHYLCRRSALDNRALT